MIDGIASNGIIKNLFKSQKFKKIKKLFKAKKLEEISEFLMLNSIYYDFEE